MSSTTVKTLYEVGLRIVPDSMSSCNIGYILQKNIYIRTQLEEGQIKANDYRVAQTVSHYQETSLNRITNRQWDQIFRQFRVAYKMSTVI